MPCCFQQEMCVECDTEKLICDWMYEPSKTSSHFKQNNFQNSVYFGSLHKKDRTTFFAPESTWIFVYFVVFIFYI